ncbi:MAG: pyridoxal phosphate-dependent aminotransferase [Thermodesulfobacteriota bacterium]
MERISKRLAGLEESATLAITAKAKALVAEGRDIIGFGAGEPDFDTPENIKEAAVRAIREGQTKYTPVGGIPELKAAVMEKFSVDNGLEYSPGEVLVSCGGKHSLYNLFQAVIDPGDEVIVPAPYWVSYPPMVELAGGTARVVSTGEENGFKMTPEELKAAVTARTRAVVINSPSNPTGAAYTSAELAGLAEAALSAGLLIVSDEIYERLTYDGFESTSVASVSDEVRRSTVVFNGVSKTYSMTGWRIGYAAGPAPIIKAMTKIQSQSTSNPCSISQWAALEALTGPQDAVGKMLAEFSLRRAAIVDGLNSIEGVRCFHPRGAFYVFPDVSGLYGRKVGGKVIEGSVDITGYLLEEAGVAVVPGAPFGEDSGIRLSYATSLEKVTEGVERIRKAAERLA